MKYIFWDLETSTLNAAYGSIIQAAAICTDEDFNILDQFDLRGRMKKEYPVPSAKALLVKIKRGAAEAPPMPDLSVSNNEPGVSEESETEEQLMERLIAEGLKGNMEEINSLDNKVLRGKIKAAIVKAKRNA